MSRNAALRRASICCLIPLVVATVVHVVAGRDGHLSLWEEKDKNGNVVIPFMIDEKANFGRETFSIEGNNGVR